MNKYFLIGSFAFTSILFADKRDELISGIKKGDVEKVTRILRKADQIQKNDLEEAAEYALDRTKSPSLSRTGWEWTKTIAGGLFLSTNLISWYVRFTHEEFRNVPFPNLHDGVHIVWTSLWAYLLYSGISEPYKRYAGAKEIARLVGNVAKKTDQKSQNAGEQPAPRKRLIIDDED